LPSGGFVLLLHFELDVASHIRPLHLADDGGRSGADFHWRLGFDEVDVVLFLGSVALASSLAKTVAREFSLAGAAAHPLALRAVHLVAALAQLGHGFVEHLHFLQLLFQAGDVGLEALEHVFGVLGLSLANAVGALAELVGEVLKLLHLRALLLEGVELLLELVGLFVAAFAASVVDPLFEVFFGLTMGLGQFLELCLHLVELFCQLFAVFFVQLAVGELLLERFEFLHGLVEVAFLDRLEELIGRAALDVLELVELLADLVGAAELLAALFDLAGQVVELDQCPLAFALRAIGEIVGSLLESPEKLFGVVEAFFLGFVGLLL